MNELNENFKNTIRDYLSDKKKINPRINEAWISRKAGIAPTTFNRILNGHSKPNITNFFKLLQVIPNLKNSLPKEVTQVLEVTLEAQENIGSQFVDNTMETLLQDKYCFFCWALSFSDKGISVEEMRDNFGLKGVTALRKLLDKKVIEKTESDRYRVIDKNQDTALSFQLIKAHLMFLIEQYKLDAVENSYVHYSMNFLNKEGKRKLMKLHCDLHKQVRSLMEDEKNKGDIPVFSLSCADHLLESEKGGL